MYVSSLTWTCLLLLFPFWLIAISSWTSSYLWILYFFIRLKMMIRSISLLSHWLADINQFHRRSSISEDVASILWPSKIKVMSGDSKVPYPKGIPLILTTEFCERFSYYGMRAILVLFCSNVILLSETNSSILFHGFTFLAYSTPIFGAILADSFIGLFMIKINHKKISFHINIVWILIFLEGNVIAKYLQVELNKTLDRLFSLANAASLQFILDCCASSVFSILL